MPSLPFQVWDLTLLSLPWVVVEMVLLAVMSSAHLLTAEVVFQQDHLMEQCTAREWYHTWLIVQVMYGAALMLITMGVALKYREQVNIIISSQHHNITTSQHQSCFALVCLASSQSPISTDTIISTRHHEMDIMVVTVLFVASVYTRRSLTCCPPCFPCSRSRSSSSH